MDIKPPKQFQPKSPQQPEEVPESVSRTQDVDRAVNRSDEKNIWSSVLMIVLAVLLVAVALVSAYFFLQNRKLKEDRDSFKSDVTSLRSVNDDLKKENGDLKRTSQAASDKSGFFVIKEFGVQFKPGDDLGDLTYVPISTNTILFSTRSLMAAAFLVKQKSNSTSGNGAALCGPADDPIGSLVRGKAGEQVQGTTYDKIDGAKKVGEYYYSIQGPQSTCSPDKTTTDLETKQNQALKNIVDTIASL